MQSDYNQANNVRVHTQNTNQNKRPQLKLKINKMEKNLEDSILAVAIIKSRGVFCLLAN